MNWYRPGNVPVSKSTQNSNLPNCLLDAIDNIAYIIVSHVWAGWETEADLEKFGLHIVGVGCATGINRLLEHRLPDWATFDFLR